MRRMERWGGLVSGLWRGLGEYGVCVCGVLTYWFEGRININARQVFPVDFVPPKASGRATE
jgi:hypothetical protein